MGWVSCAAGMVPCDARDMFVPVVSRAKPEPIATRFGPRALRGNPCPPYPRSCGPNSIFRSGPKAELESLNETQTMPEPCLGGNPEPWPTPAPKTDRVCS